MADTNENKLESSSSDEQNSSVRVEDLLTNPAYSGVFQKDKPPTVIVCGGGEETDPKVALYLKFSAIPEFANQLANPKWEQNSIENPIASPFPAYGLSEWDLRYGKTDSNGDVITRNGTTESVRTRKGHEVSVNIRGESEITGPVQSVKTNESGITTVKFQDGREVEFDRYGIYGADRYKLAEVIDNVALDRLAAALKDGKGVEQLCEAMNQVIDKGGKALAVVLMNQLDKRLTVSGSEWSLKRDVVNAGGEPWGSVLRDQIVLVKNGERDKGRTIVDLLGVEDGARSNPKVPIPSRRQ
ncbi:MAG: hypothetical protein K2W95_36055 [Candidatus Obscuribacterales bacterium]|nr:hypothetical protein [Candidatus Obscuribacterales bacterium]